jgi:phosphonate transport system ATP-binding protein
LRLELKQLSARHPAARANSPPALVSATLSIQAGEQVAIIGPSGAGKTTLLHTLACALSPSSGSLAMDGQNPWRLSRPALQRLRGQLYLAPQVPPLPPRQRVITSVLAGSLPAMGFWRSLRSLFYPVDIARAHAALEQFDLGDKIFERVDRLSGGERQRVGLARILMSPGTLWLVDEPLSALDPTRARQAMDTLLQQARERQCTLVTTLHQVEVALERFGRVVGLRDGVIAFDLPAAQVTRGLLTQLYAQHENELAPGPDNIDDAAIAPARPAVMHCR